MKLARDKLLIYGLTEKEIEAAKDEDGVKKARMIVRARADGVVVKRDVVNGNYYDSSSGVSLLTIAPLDHLWVRGRMSERDAEKVVLGQAVKVIFPFSRQEILSKIAYIDRAIDPETGSALFRTTIPNPQGRYKAGMFVRLELESDGRPDTIEAPPGPVKAPPDATTAARLDAMERKLDRLLGEDEERASPARLLRRLDSLERKVDQLLEGRERKSP
jgi:multidrug efflux pump subunit AcrA (membrane-fusion protein)